MKQLIQDLGNGDTRLIDVPRPADSAGSLTIATKLSLVSVGTERMLVDFGKSSMISKARKQPEKVKQVLEKVSTDGLLTTVDAVRSKLAQPIPLGYCNVGIVSHAGSAAGEFSPGDRVVSNGNHAEIVRVPKNLCAKIPDNVSDEAAAFTVVASIGLQGIRLANPTIGENVVVMGAGLIGLLTIQMLLANGCRVLATDFDSEKLALAKKWGAEICDLSQHEDPVAAAMSFSGGIGADAVIITASTPSNDPICQAAQMSRQRGRVILVGVIGLQLNRADFYEKELTFQVSCSYGPGRYDPNYEEKGQDYPIGFVRWTEQRNFEAVLELMSRGQIDVSDMISKRVAFREAPSAYAELTEEKSLLGVLLQYDADAEEQRTTLIPNRHAPKLKPEEPVIAFVGAGNYASRVLIPAFKKSGAQFGPIVTSAGLSGSIAAEKFDFQSSTTDMEAALDDQDVNTVVIASRHDSHAELATKALTAGKHVFVEKPLAIDLAGLDKVKNAYEDAQAENSGRHLMVGFNRRWAPMVVRMKKLVDQVPSAKSYVMTVNAGAIPADHWVQNPAIGGGRIIGEACHFLDLMRHFAGAPIVDVTARAMKGAGGDQITEDKAFLMVDFADGSHGVIHYLANGATSFPKERIEIFCDGKVLQLDNYRTMTSFGWPGTRKMKSMQQDKGQNDCVAAFHQAVRTGADTPIPFDEIMEVSRWIIHAAEQIRE